MSAAYVGGGTPHSQQQQQMIGNGPPLTTPSSSSSSTSIVMSKLGQQTLCDMLSDRNSSVTSPALLPPTVGVGVAPPPASSLDRLEQVQQQLRQQLERGGGPVGEQLHLQMSSSQQSSGIQLDPGGGGVGGGPDSSSIGGGASCPPPLQILTSSSSSSLLTPQDDGMLFDKFMSNLHQQDSMQRDLLPGFIGATTTLSTSDSPSLKRKDMLETTGGGGEETDVVKTEGEGEEGGGIEMDDIDVKRIKMEPSPTAATHSTPPPPHAAPMSEDFKHIVKVCLYIE